MADLLLVVRGFEYFLYVTKVFGCELRRQVHCRCCFRDCKRRYHRSGYVRPVGLFEEPLRHEVRSLGTDSGTTAWQVDTVRLTFGQDY